MTLNTKVSLFSDKKCVRQVDEMLYMHLIKFKIVF